MHKKIIYFLLLVFCHVAGHADAPDPAGIKKFDFGTTTSILYSGFIRVSSTNTYSAAAGYGWSGGGGGQYSSGIGLESGPPNYTNFPDQLACDYVGWSRISAVNCQFRVDLANGDYIVQVLFRNPIPIRTYEFKYSANGGTSYTTLFSSNISISNAYTRPYFLLGMGLDYTPNQDAFDKYIDRFYPVRRYTVTVTNGYLLFYFNNCALSMLAVYPQSQEAAGETWIASVKTSRKNTFNSSYYTESLPADSTPAPADDGKNYRLFTRNYVKEVYPNTKPQSYELILATTVITLSAAKGEFEPAILGVYPLSDLNNVSVTVSELAGAGGTIPVSNIEVRNAHYFEKRISNYGKYYTPVPFALMQDAAVNIPNGLTKQFWITVKVPDNAVAGDYTGTITFAPSNKTVTTIPFTVTVQNFSLPTPDETDCTYGWFQAGIESRHENYRLLIYMDENEPVKTQAKTKLASIAEKQIQSLKDHGCNSMQLPSPEMSGTSVNFTCLNIYADAMISKNFGLDPKHPNQFFVIGIANDIAKSYTEYSSTFRAKLKTALESVRDWANSKGIPIIFWVVDEPREDFSPSCQRNYVDTIWYLELCNEITGVKTTVDMLRGSPNLWGNCG
ncbi:MAG: hypothetical protein A2252_00010 [Elusimicrobia bacterium RIFOXYA2_FULL_39_19]|nr:MAG: hypothetical protein A2252_00010 [Elusimicrobia bacterium RIFOXYA2_FULL_39_19]